VRVIEDVPLGAYLVVAPAVLAAAAYAVMWGALSPAHRIEAFEFSRTTSVSRRMESL
jgi:hypothetical protein